jgi:hypothetical protein
MKPVKIRLHLFGTLVACVALLGACNAPSNPEEATPEFGAARQGVTLPGGKKNFSITFGNMDLSGATWVRLGNWTLDATNGSIAATFWQWDSTAEKGKALLNLHTCTQEGISKSCNTYTPHGWMNPSGQYFSWAGTFSYDSTTQQMTIRWSNGHTEVWGVSTPVPEVAQVQFVSSSYAITHGRGYGSNAAWSTFKTVTSVPRKRYDGARVTVSMNASGTLSVTPITAGAWYPDALDLSSYTSSANGNTLHALLPASASVCTSGCTTSRTGIVYHLSSENNGRSMVYNHFCACLPTASEFPCYNRNLHPYAFQQILDDAGNLRGFVGIEQQDEPGSAGYQYQLKEYTDF